MKIKLCSFVLIAVSFLLSGCSSNPTTQPQQPPRVNTGTPSSNTTPKDTNDYTLKGAVDYGKTGQFRYIFAFKRHDGQKMNSDDYDYLKKNSPMEVNYWLKAENGVYAVACSNFAFKQEHMDALGKRFKIEDHSEKK